MQSRSASFALQQDDSRQQLKGVLVTLLSGLIYGFTPILAKFSYAEGLSAIPLVVLRNALALPFLFLLLLIYLPKGKRGLSWLQWKQVGLLSLLGSASTTLLLYGSYHFIEVGLATNLHFLYPILVSFAGLLFFRERLAWYKWLSLALACLGLLCLYKPSAQNGLGIGLALLSALTYAFYLIYLAKSGLAKLPILQLTFYNSLVNALLLSIFALLSRSFSFAEVSTLGWLYALVISLSTTLGAVALLQLGVRLIGSSMAAILSTSEPFLSLFASWLLLGEEFSFGKILGSLCILASVLLLTLLPLWQEKRGKQSRPLTH